MDITFFPSPVTIILRPDIAEKTKICGWSNFYDVELIRFFFLRSASWKYISYPPITVLVVHFMQIIIRIRQSALICQFGLIGWKENLLVWVTFFPPLTYNSSRNSTYNKLFLNLKTSRLQVFRTPWAALRNRHLKNASGISLKWHPDSRVRICPRSTSFFSGYYCPPGRYDFLDLKFHLCSSSLVPIYSKK